VNSPAAIQTSGRAEDASPSYLTGFGNEFATEAIAGALPEGQNSPQQCPFGLYAEQISGTSFTAPRHRNRRSWLYRIRPALSHGRFQALSHPNWPAKSCDDFTPEQLRWSAMPIPEAATDFVDGLHTVAGNGNPELQMGCALHVYASNRSMSNRYLYSADGEWLIVPQHGRLRIDTEMGRIDVEPLEIVSIPRGVRFRVALPDGSARGYVCENFGSPFKLPDLGPIGSNGLANPRDFRTPVARFENRGEPGQLIAKFAGRLWAADIDHSPLDVVAWHGNHAPYKYDLRNFNTIGSVSFDHPDPSIFLVLHSPSEIEGVSNIDFVVFPPRWLAMEHTFRPPWFHRNVASEFMGLIQGVYDAKAEGFVPGGISLHNCMSGHGPDTRTLERALAADTSRPERIRDTMAFMFESRVPIKPTDAAYQSPLRQRDYPACWSGIPARFVDPGVTP
jgi:homogentisate 1,2-dioxygenase